MEKKKIIIIALIITIIIISFFIIVINKKEDKGKNEFSIPNSNNVAEYFLDETNSTYTIYEKNTNRILKVTNDASMVQMYIDNPDFDPGFSELY